MKWFDETETYNFHSWEVKLFKVKADTRDCCSFNSNRTPNYDGNQFGEAVFD